MRSVRHIVWPIALLALSSGCTLLDDFRQPPPPAPDGASTAAAYEAQTVLGYLTLLDQLARGNPSQQAEIVGQTRHAADSAPTLTNRLRYALVLALPGHASSDPLAAREALTSALSRPEGLLPTEAALAYLALQDVNARLALLSENETLTTASRDDKERTQALNRRLQVQVAENARLKQELDDALAKLEAVADLERSLAERQVAPKGSQP